MVDGGKATSVEEAKRFFMGIIKEHKLRNTRIYEECKNGKVKTVRLEVAFRISREKT